MEKTNFLKIVAVLLIAFFMMPLTLGSQTAEQTPPPTTPAGRDAPIWDRNPDQGGTTPPVIQKVREGVVRIGGIIVNKPEQFISVPGAVNMHEGLVEYLACGPLGKLHESVLMLEVDPYALQVALLLLGLEPGDNPIEYQGASTTPEGDPVEIWVSWEDKDNNNVRHRAEDLLLNQVKNKPMPHTQWVFTGSQVVDGRFMAQVEQSIAATYHDPYALLDHTLSTGADDTIYFANSNVVPAKGTPITFTIKPMDKKDTE